MPARAKRKSTSKPKPKSQNSRNLAYELAGLGIIVLGILLFLSVYTTAAGLLGDSIGTFLRGFLGIGATVAPFFFVLAGVMVIGGWEKPKPQMWLAAAMVWIVMATVQLFAMGDLSDRTLTDYALEAYSACQTQLGGGMLGAFLMYPMRYFLGWAGALVLQLALLLTGVLLITRISLKTFGQRVGKTVTTSVQKIQQYRERQPVKTRQKFDFQLTDSDMNDETEQDVFSDSPQVQTSPASSLPEWEAEEDGPELELPQLDLRASFMSEASISIPPPPEEDEYDINGNPVPEEPMVIKPARTETVQQAPQQPIPVITHEQPVPPPASPEPIPVPVRTIPPTYQLPPISLLTPPVRKVSARQEDPQEMAVKLEETLVSFGVSAKVINISRGPVITRFELQPASGVKVSRIVGLTDDIALNMAAASVRIEAPIPGKAAIGIEIPNSDTTSVTLREVLESDEFKNHTSKIAFGLGKDIAGKNIIADIARMPHMLIAGATGSGKSVCINTLIMSILLRAKPDEVKLIMVDPKVVELSGFNGIPHLKFPVVTDPKKAAGVLNWAVIEMQMRYKQFAESGVKQMSQYNQWALTHDQPPMPHIVIIVDELADLMMVAPKDVEEAICRLAQLARAAGIHLVLATQRPSVDVITGLIKANIPSRVAFMVSSSVDSRTILDAGGAEKLLGKGDMLFYPAGASKPLRVQGAYVDESDGGDLDKVVGFIKAQFDPEDESDIGDLSTIEEVGGERQKDAETDGDDPLFVQAVDAVIDVGQASASMLQRRFRVGYNRAARLVEEMEKKGIVSGYNGSKTRNVLLTRAKFNETYGSMVERMLE